jgi:hypothetical protein
MQCDYFLKERNLGRIYSFTRALQREELGAIDLRECCSFSRFRRPFHLESVAFYLREVAVGFNRPRVNKLAPFLADTLDLNKISVRFNPRLFFELPPRRFEWRLASLDFSLGNCPCPRVLVAPKRSAGKLGYLLNFGANLMRDGIERIVNGLPEENLGVSASLRETKTQAEP